MVAVGLILIISSSYFFYSAWTYPRTTPKMPTVTPIQFSPVKNASSIETFGIVPPSCGPGVGFLPANTINYSVQGSSITTQTPLNISVTLSIDWLYPFGLNYIILSPYVVIDNSVLHDSNSVLNGTPNPELPFTLVKNDSTGKGRWGLVYSIATEHTYYDYSHEFGLREFSRQILPTIILNEAGQLKGTVFMIVTSKFLGPNSCMGGSAISLQVRNTTAIYVQSFHDLQLEKQANFLENANLQNNAQIMYAEEQTQYSNDIVTTLTLVIVGFMMVDIGISLYDVSEKKNQYKKDTTGHRKGRADNKETPTD
jgi:hypothetical protein